MNNKLIRFVIAAAICVVLQSTALAKPLVLAVWSDSHFGAYDYADTTRLKIMTQINALGEKELPQGLKDSLAGKKVEFLFHCGDITEKGEPQQWNDPNSGDHRSYLQTIKHLDPAIKTYAVLGNHDSRKAGNIREDFSRLHGGTYYTFDTHGVHFFALDPYPQMNSAAPSLDEKQLEWLSALIEKITDAAPIVIVMHVLPMGSDKIERTSRLDEESSNRLAEIIAKKNVLAFFHGHWHKQSVKDFKGIPVIAPAGFAYYRDGCKGGDPVIGVVEIENGELTVYTYNWYEEAFSPTPLTTVKK